MVRGIIANLSGLIVAITGGLASIGLLLAAARNTPRLLLILFIGWVVIPFAALVAANLYVPRWSTPYKTALSFATVFIAIVSVLVYGFFTIWPPASTPARTWLLVPAASWLLMITLMLAAYLSRRRNSAGPCHIS